MNIDNDDLLQTVIDNHTICNSESEGLVEFLADKCNITPLSLLEDYLNDHGNTQAIKSEEELSNRFDSMLEECYPHIDLEDKPMMRGFFNDWTDSLCKEGELHNVQYSSYCYVGEHDFD